MMPHCAYCELAATHRCATCKADFCTVHAHEHNDKFRLMDTGMADPIRSANAVNPQPVEIHEKSANIKASSGLAEG